jgi:hypothetical protein
MAREGMMQAEQTRERTPLSREDRRAMIVGIMRSLEEAEREPPKPRFGGFPSWSLVNATLVAGLIGAVGLVIFGAGLGGEAGHLYRYLGSVAACVVSAFIGAAIATWNAREAG